MRRLWLHIGSHKTGTTTLQSSLRAAQRRGTLGNWTYVHAPKAVNLNKAVAFRGEGAELIWRIKPAVLQGYIPPSGDCIISAERFFWLNRKRDIAKLFLVLSAHFQEIKVVCYLRRQESLALSFRKTAISTVLGRSFFGDGISALPIYRPYMDRYFNYAEKLALWEDVFGADNVFVRRYGERDTVEDFSDVIGHIIPPVAHRVNRSWSRTQLLAGLWLQSRGYAYQDFSQVIEDFKDDTSLLPSKVQAVEFTSHFMKSNHILARKYDVGGDPSYFGEDYSKYPDISNEGISDLEPILKDIEARIQ